MMTVKSGSDGKSNYTELDIAWETAKIETDNCMKLEAEICALRTLITDVFDTIRHHRITAYNWNVILGNNECLQRIEKVTLGENLTGDI